MIVPNISVTSFLNRAYERCVRSVSGSVFHVRVVFGINDLWKDVVLLAGSVSVLQFLSVLPVLCIRGSGSISLTYPGCWFSVSVSLWKKSCLCIVRLVLRVSHPRSCLSFSVDVLNGVPVTSLAARLCTFSSRSSSCKVMCPSKTMSQYSRSAA